MIIARPITVHWFETDESVPPVETEHEGRAYDSVVDPDEGEVSYIVYETTAPTNPDHVGVAQIIPVGDVTFGPLYPWAHIAG